MSAPTCIDCRTSVNDVHPWSRRVDTQPGGVERFAYTWRCGPCQYKHEHPDAIPMPPRARNPKRPQAESLLDLL